jgi:hypothetical protein
VDFAIPDYKTLRGNTDGLLSDIKEKANFTFEWLQNDFAADDDDVSEGDHVVDFLFGGLFKDEESQVNLGATTLALYVGSVGHDEFFYKADENISIIP